VAQNVEGRVCGIINEIAPVPVLAGPASGKDRRHTRRAVAKHGGETFSQGRHRGKKRIIFDDFPTASVDKNKQRQNRFHKALWLGTPGSGCERKASKPQPMVACAGIS